jgi:hypothetical protein
VRKQEITCPVCHADMPLGGDEKPGDEFFCGSCGAPGLIKGDPENLEVEEDY